jgi:hypothetical protein
MAPDITIKKDYILVEPDKGADFREIKKGLARLYYVEGIPEQNRIWIFRGGPKKLSEDDLDRIKSMVQNYYPPDAEIRKTAIVIESEPMERLAHAFIEIASDLPQTFKIFSSLKDAEDWVKE